MKPNPPAPFPTREWGELKASLFVGERFSRSREKSDAQENRKGVGEFTYFVE